MLRPELSMIDIKKYFTQKLMNKQLSVLVRKPRESMPLIETESSTPALSETKAPGKTESAELERRQTKYYRGTAGSPVKLCANFIRIWLIQESHSL